MAKKKYKGVALINFKVGYKTGTVEYKIGSQFETTNKQSFDHLINTKRIKK